MTICYQMVVVLQENFSENYPGISLGIFESEYLIFLSCTSSPPGNNHKKWKEIKKMNCTKFNFFTHYFSSVKIKIWNKKILKFFIFLYWSPKKKKEKKITQAWVACKGVFFFAEFVKGVDYSSHLTFSGLRTAIVFGFLKLFN